MRNVSWVGQLIITGIVICGIIGGLCSMIAAATHLSNNQLLAGRTDSPWAADAKTYLNYQTGRTK